MQDTATIENAGRSVPVELPFKTPSYVIYPTRLFLTIAGHSIPGKLAAWTMDTIDNPPRTPLRRAETEFLQSAERIEFHCNDAVLPGYVFGDGPTVLMVHGLFGNAAQFRAMIPTIVDRGYRVVAYDLINHGNAPDGRLDAIGEHLKCVLETLGEIHAVISHSIGTQLVGTILKDSGLFPRRCVYISASPRKQDELLTFTDFFWIPRKVVARVLDSIDLLWGIPIGFSFEDVLRPHAEPLDSKSLFVHDREDGLIPFSAIESLLSVSGAADFYVTRGLGHTRILRDAGVARKVSEFLG